MIENDDDRHAYMHVIKSINARDRYNIYIYIYMRARTLVCFNY